MHNRPNEANPLVRYRYHTIEFGDTDIHVRTLRDRQQYADAEGIADALGIIPAHWPLFGVIWPSGEILARLMFDYESKGKRILEVGCGIGLASLVLNHQGADITATDHHPEVENFLRFNSNLNNDKQIPFVRADWSEIHDNSDQFDVIIGSDLLYEETHADQLSNFINRHAKPHCEVIIVDPARGNKGKFNKKMVTLGFSFQESRPTVFNSLGSPFKGWIMNYHR